MSTHFSRIEFSDDSYNATVLTNRPRMLHRLANLHRRFPDECKHIAKIGQIEEYVVPYFWFNCRKRPQPQFLPEGATFKNPRTSK